jgi:hypothetical protein
MHVESHRFAPHFVHRSHLIREKSADCEHSLRELLCNGVVTLVLPGFPEDRANFFEEETFLAQNKSLVSSLRHFEGLQVRVSNISHIHQTELDLRYAGHLSQNDLSDDVA